MVIYVRRAFEHFLKSDNYFIDIIYSVDGFMIIVYKPYLLASYVSYNEEGYKVLLTKDI